MISSIGSRSVSRLRRTAPMSHNEVSDKLDQADSSRLRFRSINDARHFAEQSVQNSRDWLAFHNLDFAKRYIQGEVVIVLDLSFVLEPADYQLVFSAVPSQDDAAA